MTVNPSTMRLGIASILIGLVGAYGVRVMMDEEDIAPTETTVEQFLVPLANQDLPSGRVIRKNDISLKKMDVASMKQASMPLDLVMMSVDQIVGRQLRKPLRLGEPFLTTAVYLQDEEPTYELKTGYRAVAVTVSMGRGGYAEAGEVVDVYFTSHARPGDPRTGEMPIPQKTIPVVDAVTVLQVTRPQLTAAHRGVAQDPSFLLQVLPDQVAKFQALQGFGDFSLMLRPSDDVGVAIKDVRGGVTVHDLLGIEKPEPPQPPPMAITEYYRRGSRSAQQFPIPMPSKEEMARMQQLYEEYQAMQAAAQAQAGDASPVDQTPAPRAVSSRAGATRASTPRATADRSGASRTPVPRAASVRRRPTLRQPDTSASTFPQIESRVPYRAASEIERAPSPRRSVPRVSAPLSRTTPASLDASASADEAYPFSDEEVLP